MENTIVIVFLNLPIISVSEQNSRQSSTLPVLWRPQRSPHYFKSFWNGILAQRWNVQRAKLVDNCGFLLFRQPVKEGRPDNDVQRVKPGCLDFGNHRGC